VTGLHPPGKVSSERKKNIAFYRFGANRRYSLAGKLRRFGQNSGIQTPAGCQTVCRRFPSVVASFSCVDNQIMDPTAGGNQHLDDSPSWPLASDSRIFKISNIFGYI